MAKSRRTPMASRKSQFCNAKLAPRAATEPGRPTKDGSSLGTMSAAHHVATDGIRNRWRSSPNCAVARASRMPLPANSNGRSAWLSFSIRRLTSWATFDLPGCSANSVGSKPRSLDVERDVNPHRAGTPAERKINGLLHVIANIAGLENRHGVFGDWLDDGNDVHFLNAELTHTQRTAVFVKH